MNANPKNSEEISEARRAILLSEYSATQASAEHHERLAWNIVGVITATSFVLIGFIFNRLGSGGVTGLAVAMATFFSIMIGIGSTMVVRLVRIKLEKYRRCHEIEALLGMEQHTRLKNLPGRFNKLAIVTLFAFFVIWTFVFVSARGQSSSLISTKSQPSSGTTPAPVTISKPVTGVQASAPPTPTQPTTKGRNTKSMDEFIKWANDNQGFVMALLTFVYVAATLWLVWLARRQLKQSTTLERSRTRPFILFDLVLDRHFVFATVLNSGQTPALDVRINVTPNIQCLLGGENTHPSQERSKDIAFIARGIGMLGPKRSINALMGYWPRVKTAHPQLRFEGTVSYRATDGTTYSEPFVADLSAHDGLLYLNTKTVEDVGSR